MHPFDVVILAVVACFTGIGIYRGFIAEVFRLAAVVGGFIGAFLFYDAVFGRLEFLAWSDQTRTVVAFAIAFLVIAAAFLAVGWLVKRIVHLTLLSWVDRLLGGIVGCAKAGMVVWIFILSAALLPSSRFARALGRSATYRFITDLPVRMQPPRRARLPRKYQYLQESMPVKQLMNTKERFGEFRDKIDSIKSVVDSVSAP